MRHTAAAESSATESNLSYEIRGGGLINIAMIILAAGLSARMGRFKPLLPVGEYPAVLRCVRVASKAGVQDITVVTGHLHERVESLLSAEAPDVRLVLNRRYEDGMFTSVQTGVLSLAEETDGFFLLPADCCAAAPETLAALIGEFAKADMKAVAHPVCNGQRGHPPLVPAGHSRDIISYNGENGLRGSLGTLYSVEVETGDPGILLDMDTPEDYAALLEYLKIKTDTGKR